MNEKQEKQFQHVLFVYGDVMSRMERHLQASLGSDGSRLLRDAERYRLVEHKSEDEVVELVEQAIDKARAEFKSPDELAIIDAARHAMLICELRDIQFGNPNLTSEAQLELIRCYPVQHYTIDGLTFSA